MPGGTEEHVKDFSYIKTFYYYMLLGTEGKVKDFNLY